MKNIFKRILFLTIVFIVYFTSFTTIEAINMNSKSKILEVYQVKTKDEVLIENNNLLEFFKNNSNNLEFITKETEDILEIEDFSLQNEIINFALQFVGNPYVSGGYSLTYGTDCSGFVKLIYSNFDILLPRTPYEQSLEGSEVSIEDIKIGDIISYGYDGYVTHSALYIGEDKIVHAATPELGIRIDNIYLMPIITIRRVI